MANTSAAAHDNEIARVLSAYAHAMDDRNVDAVLACLLEEGTIEYEGGKIVLMGHAEIREFLNQALIGPSTHLISNVLVEPDGDGARAQASAIVCVTRPAGNILIRGVTYQAQLARLGGAWKLASLLHNSTWQFSARNEI